MEYEEISNWLKNSIPGIIILGAMGSFAAVAMAWLLGKFAKALTSLNRYLVVRVVGANIAKFLIHYLRLYYTVRATIAQLFNKDKELPLIVIHQNFLANRNLSGFAALLFFVVSLLMLLLHGTDFPKSTAAFIALALITTNDAIAYGIWANKVAAHFYGHEQNIAEETYKTREAVLIESIESISRMKARPSNIGAANNAPNSDSH